jgi:hypothetical protein
MINNPPPGTTWRVDGIDQTAKQLINGVEVSHYTPTCWICNRIVLQAVEKFRPSK